MADHKSNDVHITAVQKMVSATSGSLLTSLLVTPLDVVRVRWQSQSVPKPAPNLGRLTSNLAKVALDAGTFKPPASLGVTACCREVFFMSPNAEFCLAGPKLDGLDRVPASVSSASSAWRPNVNCAVEQVQRKTITSTVDGMRKIARHEGFTALWRGLSPTLVMAIPANIIYFTGYDWLRYSTNSPIAKATKDAYTPLVAGSFARILAATAVSPIELFRTRLQATSGASAAGHLVETLKSVEEMVKHQGYKSLWKGLTLTLWRDAPFSGIYWWGYETTRSKLASMREKHGHLPLELEGHDKVWSQENQMDTFIDSFTAGAISGAIASILTMPFDVGKTRTQVYLNSTKVRSSTFVPEEQSMIRLLWHIFHTEGASGLWKGWVPRTLKVAPACAIMISSYEIGKRAFRTINERAQMHDGYD